MIRGSITLAIFGLSLFLSAPLSAYTDEVVGEVQAVDRDGRNVTVNGVTAEITEATQMFTHLREPLRMKELAVGVPVDMVVRGSAEGTEAVSIIATVAR